MKFGYLLKTKPRSKPGKIKYPSYKEHWIASANLFNVGDKVSIIGLPKAECIIEKILKNKVYLKCNTVNFNCYVSTKDIVIINDIKNWDEIYAPEDSI